MCGICNAQIRDLRSLSSESIYQRMLAMGMVWKKNECYCLNLRYVAWFDTGSSYHMPEYGASKIRTIEDLFQQVNWTFGDVYYHSIQLLKEMIKKKTATYANLQFEATLALLLEPILFGLGRFVWHNRDKLNKLGLGRIDADAALLLFSPRTFLTLEGLAFFSGLTVEKASLKIRREFSSLTDEEKIAKRRKLVKSPPS